MASILELVGTPGAGKSTLAALLAGRRVGGRRLVGVDTLLTAGAMRSGPSVRLRRRRPIDPTVRADALERWAATRGLLLELLAERALGTDVADTTTVAAHLRRLRAPAWLLTTLELHALAEAAPDDRVVVLHEGLLQRAGVVCGSDPDPDLLAGYVDRAVAATPEVALVVQLRCAPAACRARVRAREVSGAVNRRHVGLDDAGLEADLRDQGALLDRAVDAARGAGRRVLVLDTDMIEPEASAGAIVAALSAAGA